MAEGMKVTGCENGVLDQIIVNGRVASELSSEKVRTSSSNVCGLTTGDLVSSFQLTSREAGAVLETIRAAAGSIGRKRQDLCFVDFDHIPICRSQSDEGALKCVDKELKCRENFLNESCFAVSADTNGQVSVPKGNWSPANYLKVREWLSKLEMTRDESQVVISDYDNTLVAGTIGPVVSKEAEIRGLAKWKDGELPPYLEYYKETHPDFVFDPIKVTPHGWWDILSKFDPQLDANALSMGFAGMTVKQIADCVEGAEKRSPDEFPKPYPELLQLFNHLLANGKHIGVVSASPYLAVAISLKKAGYKVPLYGIEGTDFYVKHPKTGAPVALSNLVNTELIKEKPDATIDDVIERYGDLVALRNVDPVQRGQEGKAPAGTSVAWRAMDFWNKYVRKANERALTVAEMRLIGYFGDNTAPFSDMIGSNPVQSGNDQGMVRVLIPENVLIMNVNRGIDKGDGTTDFSKKAKNTQEFRNFVEQLRSFYHDPIVIEQDGVYEGKGRGVFVNDRAIMHPSETVKPK